MLKSPPLDQIDFLPFNHVEERDMPMLSFQSRGVIEGLRRPKYINAMDKGTGKTRVSYTIAHNLGAKKIAILCTSRATLTWWLELLKWVPWMAPHFRRVDAKVNSKGRVVHLLQNERKAIWEWAKSVESAIVVSTYASACADYGLRTYKGAPVEGCMPKGLLENFDLIITDEWHRYMRRRNSAVHILMYNISKAGRARIIQNTGSAARKGPEDVWPALNVSDPSLWSSYWRYVHTYCEIDDTGFGKKILGPKAKTLAGWRQSITPYIYRVNKDDPEIKALMPPKTRVTMPLHMHADQAELYAKMEESLIVELNKAPDLMASLENVPEEMGADDFIVNPTALQQLYSLRLLAICPKAVHPSLGYGAGIEGILDAFDESEKNHGVLFTPFKKPIPYLEEYIKANCKIMGQPSKVYILKGGVPIDEAHKMVQQWKLTGGWVICTVAYAESFELIHASESYHLGYEWDGELNKQAEDRLNRLSSPGPTLHNYVMLLNTRDEQMLKDLIRNGMNVRVMFGESHESEMIKSSEDVRL